MRPAAPAPLVAPAAEKLSARNRLGENEGVANP